MTLDHLFARFATVSSYQLRSKNRSMLMLLFGLGDTRYALQAQQITEILPLVTLHPQPQTPPFLAGLFNYRGDVIPVIDLRSFLQGTPCCTHFGTRILVVNSHLQAAQAPQPIGLLAERVTETLSATEAQLIAPSHTMSPAPYLGKLIIDQQGMIQCLQIEFLLSQVLTSLPPSYTRSQPSSNSASA